MDKPPVWLLRNKKDNIVWCTVDWDFPTVVEDLLRFLGYKLIKESPEQCQRCGFAVSRCVCQLVASLKTEVQV